MTLLSTVVPTKSDSDIIFCLQLLSIIVLKMHSNKAILFFLKTGKA